MTVQRAGQVAVSPAAAGPVFRRVGRPTEEEQ